METIVKVTNKIENKGDYKDDKLFKQEFAKGYLELELIEKNTLLSEYLYAYQEIDNKDSFNAQYLESLIELLKQEIESYHQ
ncbi:MAG: hypothetical protein ACFFD5_12270 [Candidatus Thorarchaeota archaeon]